jgi:hypothetical protein
MPVKRRSSKHRAAVKDFEAAWLAGDRKVGFMYSLHHDFVHQELWDRAGDHEAFFWEPGMDCPEPKQLVRFAMLAKQSQSVLGPRHGRYESNQF